MEKLAWVNLVWIVLALLIGTLCVLGRDYTHASINATVFLVNLFMFIALKDGRSLVIGRLARWIKAVKRLTF